MPEKTALNNPAMPDASETSAATQPALEATTAPCTSLFPFTVTLETYQKALVEWFTEGHYVPNDIFDGVTFVSQQGMYVPTYVYHGDYNAVYTCEIGYDRSEIYTETVTKTENGRSYKELVQRTRTVTDWQPYGGNFADTFCVEACATSYFSRLSSPQCPSVDADEDEIAQIPNFCVENGTSANALPYDATQLGAFHAMPRDLSAQEAYEISAAEQANAIIASALERALPGDHQRNLNWNAQMQHSDTPIYKPFWITKYLYNGAGYVNVSDGTDATKHCGTKPFDAGKRNTVSKFFAPFQYGLCGLVGLILMLLFGFKGAPVVLPFYIGFLVLSLLYGFVRKAVHLKATAPTRRSKCSVFWQIPQPFLQGKQAYRSMKLASTL